jgi:hypothetical protein
MIRRDTERIHFYADEIFKSMKIFDIQGVLKEGDVYKCGVESYQVRGFNAINFDVLNTEIEIARLSFCNQLKIPYYLIFVSEDTGHYKLYTVKSYLNHVKYDLAFEFSKTEFLNWWRAQQSFTQKKAMYNAGKRIAKSIIDKDLFSNALAWGINVDGFSMSDVTKQVNCIYEKRICTYKPPYTVENYDPNRFFHGTANRSGDYPSWKILSDLSVKMNASLLLLTFDTSSSKRVGVVKIKDVSRAGLHYLNNLSPYKQLFTDELEKVKIKIISLI